MDYSKDYYKILGVEKNASKKDIAAAYKKMIRKWHPDLFASKSKEEQDKANAMAADINEANDILSDDAKRQEYDMVRDNGGRRNPFEGMGGRGFSPFSNFDPFDDPVFNRMRRNSGFQNFHRQRAERNPTKGRTISINVELPFEDFFFGCKKTLDIKVQAKCSHCKNGLTGDTPEYETCEVCGGQGMRVSRNGNMILQETCQYCDGTGQVLKNKCGYCNGTSVDGIRIQTLEFEIPKDTRDFYTKRYDGVGHCGVYGGESGDIIISAAMSDKGMFFNRGNNVLGTIHFVSLFKALGGGIETILTPYGKKNIMIPSGMEDGHEIKFSGMGLKGKGGEPDGSLVVTFKYDMPKKLNSKIVDELTKIAEKTESDRDCFVNVAAERDYMNEYIKRLG